ncbi:hypothetical protein VZH09_13400 [Synechococcus elongatus IITB7]|uniref:hypothetical protein n=1 Tax=Synechococcus elongatus TaxID=32046 RepID=UPI0030CC2F06
MSAELNSLQQLLLKYQWNEIRNVIAQASYTYVDGYCSGRRPEDGMVDTFMFPFSHSFFVDYDWDKDPMDVGFQSALEDNKEEIAGGDITREDIKVQLMDDFCERYCDCAEISYSGSYSIEMGVYNLEASVFEGHPRFATERGGYSLKDNPYYVCQEGLSYYEVVKALMDEFCIELEAILEYLES